ncbi:AAA family ATPase [Sphingomonas montanisoli]|uniref:AAA family ATPase n=1 Tax=Sphingomonas montanisoli TaxID=2606412 RepID=A0A5D9C1Y8_9SPHN|nr:AAA family ATPase [Sphingomonas montanisoli]TZG25888.1 AAA family ATPase [Sphingomonas montanisoli]
MASQTTNDPFASYGRAANANGSAPPIDFVGLAPRIVGALLDKPNKALSTATQLRFGNKGSLSVDLDQGRFYDHELKTGGGMLDLIQREQGCDAGGALAWMEEQGLKDRDHSPSPAFQAQILPIYYDYRDENGAVISRVKRSPDKRFIQLGPDGNGGFHAAKGCMDGVRRVPYRLPELLASDVSRAVFICEGEKDADRLVGLGLIATCNSEGAGKFRRELVPFFKGRRCVVLEDNDPAGAEHARDVAEKLTGMAAVVTILKLPDLPPKGDVSDWLAMGGTVDQLKTLARSALDQPADVISLPVGSQDVLKATPYTWCEPSTIPPRPWVLGRYLLRGVVTAAIAPGGVGKTTFLCGTALSLITGQPLLGKSVWDGPKRVWIWNLEDPLQELQRSIQAAAKRFGLTRQEVEGRLFVDTAMDGTGLCTAVEDETGFRLLAPVYEAITAELIARSIDLLVIDPFVSSHEVDENANTKIDKIAKAWSRVANAANCCIVLVHHTSKAGSGEVTALSARGAKALTDACRSALVLNRMDAEVADKFGFDDQERRRYFSVQDDKHNRAPAENADWYRLESVDLCNGGENGHSDSIGVAIPWTAPDPFDGLTGNHLLRVQMAIDGGEWRENHQSPNWAGRAAAEVLGLDVESRSDKRRLLQMMKTWLSNGALVTVEREDAQRRPRKFIEVGKWQSDNSAPPGFSGADSVERAGAKVCSTTTRHISGGVERSVAGRNSQVEQDTGGAADRCHDNPALGRSPSGMILAPGESEDDPVPGWENIK